MPTKKVYIEISGAPGSGKWLADINTQEAPIEIYLEENLTVNLLFAEQVEIEVELFTTQKAIK